MTGESFAAAHGGPAGLISGALVAGHRIESQLGAGRTAVVYQARDERLGRVVALKILRPALAADGQFRERFIYQTRAAASLGHPHILPVYEAGLADGVLFVSMRLVAGGDLRQVLQREGALAPARAAAFVSAVASALDAAHDAGLVHGAVRPASILLEAQPGWPEHPYLSDFGLSQGAMSQSGPAAPEYCAPEQITGRAVDGRADQYALACVAFALLAGAPPFVHEDPRTVLSWHASGPAPLLSSRRPGFPPSADQVLARALAKDPQDRYGGCQEFAAALQQALGLAPYGQAAAVQAQPPLPAQAYAPPPVQACPPPQALVPPPVPAGAAAVTGPSPSWRRSRHRLLAIAAVAGALLVTAAVVVPVLVLPGGRKPAPSASGKPAAAAIRASLAATLTNPEGSNGVNAVAFSPDGTTLALGDGYGRTYLWDVGTGRLTATLTDPHSGGVMEVKFSPDGKTLATGDLNDRTYLWDVASGRLTATLSNPQAGNPSNLGIAGLAFSPDGQMLAAGDDDGSTYLWNVATGRITATLTDPVPSGDDPEVGSIALSPDGTMLAAGDVDDSTYVWDVATGRLAATLSDPGTIGNGAGVGALAFSPDGKILAAGDGDDNTYLWDLATGRRVATLPDRTGGSQSYVTSVAFSPGGATLATGDNGGSTYLWNVAAGRLAATLKDPGSGSSGVDAVAFSPDGKTLAIAVGVGLAEYTGRDNTYLWRIK